MEISDAISFALFLRANLNFPRDTLKLGVSGQLHPYLNLMHIFHVVETVIEHDVPNPRCPAVRQQWFASPLRYHHGNTAPEKLVGIVTLWTFAKAFAFLNLRYAVDKRLNTSRYTCFSACIQKCTTNDFIFYLV